MDDSRRRGGDMFFGGDPRNDDFDNFFHGRFGNTFDIFQPFRHLMNSFFSDSHPEMFHPFGSVESIEPLERNEPANPRDQMLRQPDGFQVPQYHWFDNVFPVPELPSAFEEKPTRDTDLDDRIRSDGLQSVMPARRSFSSSFSTRIIRTADGKLEEHRTVRDSTGKEETTVKRVYGDQSHSVTTKRHQDGQEEIVEDFVNMDEKMLGDFNKNWKRSTQRREEDTQIASHDNSGFLDIFRKFFLPNSRES